MKADLKFRVGSGYFFNKFEDYIEKDRDYVIICEEYFPNNKMFHVKLKNDDLFMYPSGMTKEWHINDIRNNSTKMRAGKFLIPEFCEYIGFTIDDLKTFEDYFNSMDSKHIYEKMIYDFYIENNEFKLTDEQLKAVFEEYKAERDYLYKKEN